MKPETNHVLDVKAADMRQRGTNCTNLSAGPADTATALRMSLRSRIMRSVKSENTLPELVVRSTLHRLGYRFRLHRPDLPGKPDIVFPRDQKVIFVHGCFWHGHDCVRGARVPKTNRAYWLSKIARNKARYSTQLSALEALGWQALTIWECQCRDVPALTRVMNRYLRRTSVVLKRQKPFSTRSQPIQA